MKIKHLIIVGFSLVIALLLILFILNNNNYFEKNFVKNTEYIKIENIGEESCQNCHEGTKGDSDYHNPKLIGCISCHLGNPNTLDKKDSHKGMVLIPGNLSDAKATCGTCHPNELAKIENSLMTTNSGLVAVNKYIFGEADSPDYQYHIKDVKHSAADKHIRDLCANCHLG
ncbi:MAG: hypothetical protein Q7U21_03870, partial [Lutibacter sp.]|nr:hypothetical protein [Lutibacter sp.]